MDGSRDQFLLGASFADDEQRPRDARDALDLIHQFLDLPGLSDDLEARLDRLAQPRILLVKLPVAVDGVEQAAHLAEKSADPLPKLLAGHQKVARSRSNGLG